MLEELLNKLIELWWQPRWSEDIIKITIDQDWFITYSKDWWCPFEVSYNDLCSIDSWLWQFVCKNKLYWEKVYDWLNEYVKVINNVITKKNTNYRLMLSSIQKDKEKFILENIKIKWN